MYIFISSLRSRQIESNERSEWKRWFEGSGLDMAIEWIAAVDEDCGMGGRICDAEEVHGRRCQSSHILSRRPVGSFLERLEVGADD